MNRSPETPSPEPQAPQPSKLRLGAVLIRLLGVLLFSAALIAGWFVWDYQRFAETPLAIARPLVLEVKPGRSVAALGRELAGRGLMRSPRYFTLLARIGGHGRRIKAGEYRLEPGVTPRGLLEKLVAGRPIEYAITLVEGWSFRQVMAAIEAEDRLEHSLAGMGGGEVMTRLGHPDEHPEGRFFPDTYRFPKGESDLSVLRRAYERMEQVLAEEWAGRESGLPLQGPYQALTLASIVEKETGRAAERPEIAGVFVRRLRKGMLLQTDPTVIYGLGDAFDGNLRRRDLKRDTPYNSYTRKGLPPTPIAMPGREAIRAVLHPADGNALYFVAKGDGSHHFSATLREHNRAVRKYQLGQ
ncbi:endolytic transglycosylase MltG [Endothiovibrio diazotrophicus]